MYPSYKKSLACCFFSLIKSKSMAAPVINQQQQQQQQLTWVPYETAKDCSQGFCSIYCPQWCSKIFPPPPPFSFFVDDDDDSSNNTAFSPLVITIIGILASAFLLISYYTIISKYCGGFRLLRRPRRNNNHNIPDDDDDDDPVVESDVEDQSRSGRHGAWHVSASNGLDQALINKISVYRYKRGDGLVDGTDCSVCLSEFREEESLRLLPKCSHAFHLQCIDTWLGSHSNCPLCRANIVSVNSAPSQLPAAATPPPPPPPPPLPILAAEGDGNDDVVVEMERLAQAEETNAESDENMSEHDAIDISDDGGGDAGSSPRGRVSIADILELSMEDEFTRAKERGILVGSGSSSRSSRGENSTSRSLHYVMSPVAMKRSVSSGRFGFPRQAKGRNTILPIPRNFENFDTLKRFPSFL